MSVWISLVIYGFHALQLLSSKPCSPFDVNRTGLNLGEAGGFALLTSAIDDAPPGAAALLGYGESLDAYHMSSAHPEGLGAECAMQAAAVAAGVPLNNIDYLNFHGTGTLANDAIESLVCSKLFPDELPCSSTKGWTGHTLGTAGILEAIITLESMKYGIVPGTLNCEETDPEFGFPIMMQNIESPIRHAMSNSFGFGGNNATLIFGRNNA